MVSAVCWIAAPGSPASSACWIEALLATDSAIASERCSDCRSSSWLACQTAAAAPMSADSKMIAAWKTRIW